MKKIASICISLLFICCTTPKKKYNTIDFKENGTLGALRTIRISTATAKFQSQPLFEGNPSDKGVLLDTFSIAKPGIYILDLATASTAVYLEKGDVLQLQFSSTSFTPSIVYGGTNSSSNTFLFDSKKVVATALDKLTESDFENNNEATILKTLTQAQKASEAFLEANKSKVAAPLLQFVKTENECAIVNACLFYKYKQNKFSNHYINTPQLDLILKQFNSNDKTAFESSPSYKGVVYEFYKSDFNKTAKGNDLKAFWQHLKNKNVEKEIQEYLLCIYATNYFITDYSTPNVKKETYTFLTSVLTDKECIDYIQSAYSR